jgi:hypothetical protein
MIWIDIYKYIVQMEAYIINTSIGFVNNNKGDAFIEIGDIERNEEINEKSNFFMTKIRNLLSFRKSNKIDIEDFV